MGGPRRLGRVTREAFAERAAEFAPFVMEAAATSNGRMTADSIVERLVNGDWYFFAVRNPLDEIEAFLAVQIWTDESGAKVCSVRFAVGNGPHRWVHLIAELEIGAKAAGCQVFEAWARKGWAKYLPDYKLTHVQLEKRL